MTDITIPHGALVAAAKKVGHHRFGKQWDCLTLYEQGLCYVEARAACLAMLAAWPGMEKDDGHLLATKYTILLPLTEPRTSQIDVAELDKTRWD
jgi:hypothetical protein